MEAKENNKKKHIKQGTSKDDVVNAWVLGLVIIF